MLTAIIFFSQAVSSSFGSSSFQYQETAINFSSHSPITNTIFSGSSALHVVSQEIAIVSTVSTLDPSLLPYYSSDADTTRSEDEESAAASSLDGSLTPILMLDGQYSQQSSLLPLAASVGEEFAHAMDVAEQEVEEAVNNLVSLSSSSSRVKPLFIDVSGNDVSHLVGRPNEEPIPFEMIDSLQDVTEEGATREVYDHDDEDDEHEEVFVEDVTVDTVATDNEVDLVESSTVLLLPPVEVSIEEEVIVSSMPTISATGVATKPSTPRHSLADIDTDDDQLGEHSSLPMDKTVAQQATSSPLTTGTSSSITPVKPGLGIRRESLRSSKSRPSSQEQEVTPPVASSGPIQPSISQSTAKDSSTGTHCGSDDDDVVDRLPQQSASEPFVSCDVIRSRLRELLNGEIEPLNKQVTTKPSPLVSGRRMLTQKALLEEIGYSMRTDTTAPQQTLQRFLKAQGETSGVTNPVYPIAVKYFEMRDRDVLRQNKKNMGERKREREIEPHSVQQGIDIGMNLDNPLFETQAAIKRMREPLNEFNGDDDMASEEHMEASCPSQPMTTSTTGQRTMSTLISETLPGIVEQMKVADEMKMPLLDDLLADMAVSLPHATGRGSNSSVHTTELDNLIVYDNCDEVRMKVNNFLRDYSCSVYRFSAYLGMSSTTLSGFLVKVGPDSGKFVDYMS